MQALSGSSSTTAEAIRLARAEESAAARREMASSEVESFSGGIPSLQGDDCETQLDGGNMQGRCFDGGSVAGGVCEVKQILT